MPSTLNSPATTPVIPKRINKRWSNRSDALERREIEGKNGPDLL